MSESVAWWDFAALEGLRADDRLRVLSREASAVLFRLVLVARAGGEVPYLNHHTGAQSAAVYDLRESDTTATREVSAKAVKELVDTGLVTLDDGARVIRLDLHAGLLSRAAAPSAPRVATGVAESGRPRQKPSDTPARREERKLRFQFGRRSGPFRGVSIPEGATWEAWSASAEGAAFLAARNAPENAPGTPHGNAPRERPGTPPERPPSLTLSPPEKKGNSTKEGENAGAGNAPGTPPRNAGENAPGNAPERPLLPTVEHVGLRVEELVDTLRARSAGAVLVSGGGDSQIAVALQRTLTGLAAGPLGATRASLATLADWYAAGAQRFRASPLGLRELAQKPGLLAEHLEAALAWHAAGRPAFDDRGNRARPAGRSHRLAPAAPSARSAFAGDDDFSTDPLHEVLNAR